jgi:hypothetical protein
MTGLPPPCHSPSIGKRETLILKLTADRPFADPEKAARRLLEYAHDETAYVIEAICR